MPRPDGTPTTDEAARELFLAFVHAIYLDRLLYWLAAQIERRKKG